jgi:hypothetical protein
MDLLKRIGSPKIRNINSLWKIESPKIRKPDILRRIMVPKCGERGKSVVYVTF